MEKMSCLEKEVMISDKFIFMNFVFLSDKTFVSNEKIFFFNSNKGCLKKKVTYKSEEKMQERRKMA